MASNMTTGEKLKHPVAAAKQMMGKGNTGTNIDDVGTHTRATNETGAPFGHRTGAGSEYSTGLQNEGLPHNRQPLNVNSEDQMSNEMRATNLETTAGMGNRNVYSESAGTAQDPYAQRHTHGHHVGEGVAGAGVGGVGAYEAEKHLGGHHQGQHHHQTHVLHQGDVDTNQTGGYGKLDEKLLHPHGHHTGTHMAEGAGIGGVGAYEAEKHLGHHNRTGENFNRTGENFNRTGDNLTGGALGSEHMPHHQQHHGHHVGEGVAGAGVGGVGAYEAEKHLGHHHGHNTAGTGGGRVYSPNDPDTHNTGLNVIGMNTPNFSRDLRDHTNSRPEAEGAPTLGNTSDAVIDHDRVQATSLPANPLMSLVTGGKIPASIHKGAKQAGIDTDRGHGGTSDFMGGNNDRRGDRNINETTGNQDTNRTGRFNDASDINNDQTGLTGGRTHDTNRAGFTGNDRNVV